MPKKDTGNSKEAKEKGSLERSGRRETPLSKQGKGREKESVEKSLKKEPSTSKDLKGDVKDEVEFELNSKVLCKYRDSLYYEAKIIAIDDTLEQGKMFTVHYQGWNSRHDEKIPQGDVKARFLQCTEANLEMARTEMQEARQSEKKRKSRKFPGIGDEKKAGGTDSRSSTPSDKLPSAPASIASVERVGGGRKMKGGSTRTAPMQNEVVEPPKKEIRIEMPPTLMELLVDDYDMITRQMHLTKLPARHTVDQIIKQYADYVKDAMPNYKESTVMCGRHEIWLRMDALTDCALGIQDFFNATLGARLLYKFEYLQYDHIVEEKIKDFKKDATLDSQITDDPSISSDDFILEKKWKPSDTYGFIYLLRLLVRFGSLLGEANWEEQGERSVISTLEYIARFIKFLDENRQNFFDVQKDYMVATPDYQKRYADIHTI